MSSPSIKKSKLHELLLAGRCYPLRKKQILQSTEDRQVVNIVIKGFVRKYWITNDGSIGVQIVYGPGDIFPLTLAYKKLFNQSLYSGRETFFYEAVSDAEVCTINTDRLVEAVEQDSQLYIDLLQEAGRHLEFCIHSLENLSLPNSEKRIAHLLWYFAIKFGVQGKDGVHITLPISHQNIGEVLNITRETVTNHMKTLRDKNLIKTGRQIVIPNIKKIEKEIYG